MRKSYQPKPTIGVSSCLLGEKVRYDGSDKNNSIVTQELSQYFLFKAFCPEMAIGLGVPRETIHLIKTKDVGVRCKGTHSSELDVTDALTACVSEQIPWIKNLAGYVFKARSPSCGVQDTPIYTEVNDKQNDLQAIHTGDGMFVYELKKHYPALPLITEGELAKPHRREAFIAAVLRYAKQT